jgi:predicted alpha/beta-hydrolase family hydrolase
VVILAHIAGIPVEETLAAFVPVWLLGAGAGVQLARGRLRRLRDRRRRRPSG